MVVLASSIQAASEPLRLAPTWLGSGADIAVIIVALTVVALLFVVVFAILQFRNLVVKTRNILDRMEPQIHPVLERARGTSENVEFITRALRKDVERLTGSVEALTARLHQASDRMEERIEEFNALMEVVQLEAEGIFVQTASTVRGVRAGAEALGQLEPPDSTTETDDADRETDPPAAEMAG
jgi:uncharacterized protein YoxC